MGKTFKYVKDFDFSSAGKAVGYCGGGMAKKNYADGGVVGRATAAKKGSTVAAIGKQEAAVMKSRMMPEGSGMHRDTSSLGIKGNKNPGIPRKGVPVAPKQPMIPAYGYGGGVKKANGGAAARPTRAMPDVSNKTGAMRGTERAAAMSGRDMSAVGSRPTATTLPAAASPRAMMKTGGSIPKSGAYKVPKVMSEYKAGELHSGSKTGPVVKSRKQAVAIALSEARAAGKKK